MINTSTQSFNGEDGNRAGIVALFANAAHHAGYSYRVDDSVDEVVLFLIPKITRTRRVKVSLVKVAKATPNVHEGNGAAA